MPKKILVVVSSLNIGGTENHIQQVFPHLNNGHYQVAIYTTSQRGTMAKSLRAKGVKIYSSRLGAFFHRFGKLGRLCAYLFSTLKLIAINLWYRPDIVHCYLPGPYILGGFCARITRRPYLIMSRRGMNFYQKKYPRLAKHEKKLQQKTTRILANSKRVLKQLCDEEQIPEERLRLIYNGLDLVKYKKQTPSPELRQALRISEDAFVLVIVANLFAYKGHIDLLKALAGIKDQLPEDWVLLCVGRDEGCLQALCDYAAESELSSHIQWLDQRDDVPKLLALSNIGVLCSHEEGFSNSVIEGMAAGLPMVVTDVGGNAEAVIDNEMGFVVPPKNPTALGEAILRLANDKQLRDRMGDAAMRRVQSEFSLDHCVDAYNKMYAELV